MKYSSQFSLIFIFLTSTMIHAQEKQPDKKSEKETLQLKYPETKKADSVTDYFGTKVQDPYRWLEDDRSEETENWVKAQNKVTFDYLKQIPYRDELNKRLTKLWNYEKLGAPFTEGGYVYFFKNDGLQNQYVVYRKKGENEEAEIFLDPNKFSEDGTTSLSSLNFSKDGKKAAYSISEGGSDWRKILVLDTETKEIIEDTLIDVKFSGVSWKADEGFFYSSYEKPEGSELSAKTDQHRLFYHKLGTPQSEDKLIFGGLATQKHRYVGGSVTEDDHYLFISARNSTSGGKLFMMDLTKENPELVTILDNENTDSYVIENDGSKLYIVTNMDAPNRKVVTVDASDPVPGNWKDFIPETKNVLSPSSGGGFIFANYMVDAISKVKQYDYDGNLVRDVELPGIGTVGGFGAKKEEKTLYYSFTNYVTPGNIYKYELERGTSELYNKPNIDFDPEEYQSQQIFFTSKDGTKIPMIITHKKGLVLNGKNPTILYGYGGFNISLTPSFSIANAVWMEQGGIYAVPNLRGGGEYGKDWHDAGIKLKKQNVFDDFIAAAEYLIQENYTSSDYLAIRGGSNGGLLVGANDAKTRFDESSIAGSRRYGHVEISHLHRRSRMGLRLRNR